MNTIALSRLEGEVQDLKLKLSFREYILKEAKQVGYIYHFTTPSKIENILKYGIKKGKSGYTSLTRDFQLPNKSGYFNTGEYIIRVCVDGDKLSNNVKIIPYYDANYNDEAEEAVINDISKKYIKQIDILTSDNRVFSRNVINYLVETLCTIQPTIKVNKVKKFQPIKS